jgi:hypothetical protein
MYSPFFLWPVGGGRKQKGRGESGERLAAAAQADADAGHLYSTAVLCKQEGLQRRNGTWKKKAKEAGPVSGTSPVPFIYYRAPDELRRYWGEERGKRTKTVNRIKAEKR